MSEMVLTIPSKLIEGEGIIKMSLTDLEKLVSKNTMFFERQFVETEPNYKQLIPYVVLKDDNQYIIYKRTTNQTEERLHNLYSIGIGGHINVDDKAPTVLGTIMSGMLREIEEEVSFEIENLKYVGLLNYNGNPVSQVHLGIVFIAEGKFYGVNEKDNFEIYLDNDLTKYLDKFEDWSRIVAEYLLEKE